METHITSNDYQKWQPSEHKNERAIGDCVLAKICHSFWPTDLVIWSLTLKKLWPVSDYIRGLILITIGQKLWLVSSWTQYIMECRGLTLSSPCDVISDVFIKKYILVFGNSNMTFHFWCQIKAILKITKFSKLTKFWGPTEFFVTRVTESYAC